MSDLTDSIANAECPLTEADLLAPILHQRDIGADWIDSGTYPTYWKIGNILRPVSIAEIGVRYGYSLYSLVAGSNTSVPDKSRVKYIAAFDSEHDHRGSNEYAMSKLEVFNQT